MRILFLLLIGLGYRAGPNMALPHYYYYRVKVGKSPLKYEKRKREVKVYGQMQVQGQSENHRAQTCRTGGPSAPCLLSTPLEERRTQGIETPGD